MENLVTAQIAPTLEQRLAEPLIGHVGERFGGMLALRISEDRRDARERIESQSAEIARQAAQLKAAEYSAKTWERAAEQADEREAAANARNARMTAVLQWYEAMVADCRKITSEGDIARSELDSDGGAKARAALDAQPEQGVEK